jgi:hypothetical protein
VKVVDPSRSCSEQSVMAGEPIFGTAVAEVEVWLLVEYRERWERDIAETPFSDVVKAWLAGAQQRIKRLRVQLIRRPSAEGDLSIFVVTTGAKARVRRYLVPTLEDAAAIDVVGAVADVTPSADDPAALYLVCGHGRRDRCCALRGIALYKTLSEQVLDGELWQSSHQGGHRFAATLLYLPIGVHYGRLDPEDAEPLARAHAARRLYHIGRYRGQTRYSQPVQTAEAWLREQELAFAFDAVELVEQKMIPATTPDGSSQYSGQPRFITTFRCHSKLHHVTVVPRTGTIGRAASCEGAEATLPSWHYVVRHEAEMLA